MVMIRLNKNDETSKSLGLRKFYVKKLVSSDCDHLKVVKTAAVQTSEVKDEQYYSILEKNL